MKDKMITIYTNVIEFKKPYYIKLETALNRIKNKKSEGTVEKLRSETDEERRSSIKKSLPVVVFAGKFGARRDNALIEPSNLIVLDFDNVDVDEKKKQMREYRHTVAAWVSPGGKGVKALIRIANHEKHSGHFRALMQEFPELDSSGKNISRACFESCDPDIYINYDAEVFREVAKEVHVATGSHSVDLEADDGEIYEKLKIWLTNKREAFAKGNRNSYIFKLASACCRYGMNSSSCLDYILRDYSTTDFSQKEIMHTVKSAYRSNQMGVAKFDKKGVVVDWETGIEIEVEDLEKDFEEYKHTIFARDVYDEGLKIFRTGYERIEGINCPTLDYLYKAKRQEITLVSGYGNMGKSTILLWYLVNRAVIYDEKFALFPPESAPAEEFYLEIVEMLAGCDCSAKNPKRISEDKFRYYWEWVDDHFYFVYPEKEKPDIETVKESFLELIIKHKISGVAIDPFNQLSHSRSTIQREDFYLEEVLSDFTRFAQQNDIYFWVVAHPNLGSMQREDGDVKAPDMWSISGGAMWSNKMHNILIYHRPLSKSDPTNPLFSFTSSKIKKQKIVGKRGTMEGHYILSARRFLIPKWNPITREYDISDLYDPLESNMKFSEHVKYFESRWSEDIEENSTSVRNTDDIPF